MEQVHQVCTIDLPRCIGCTLCHQVCPWDCITMLPTDQFLQNKQTVPQLE
jgi:formate hydrogenlyase subunit 6/NADH:ubiquinone oxidoreductase subunit I